MASGILGSANLAANTNTTVYTVPVGAVASFAVNLCNTSLQAAAIRLAIASTGTPDTAEYILYDIVLEPNGFLERTGLVAQAGENVVINSTAANVAVNVYGFEE